VSDPQERTYEEQYGPRKEFEPMPIEEPKPRRKMWGGCVHTPDPNGFLMDDDGRIYGRCNCGEVAE
jgi:hypothetical protein